MGTFLTSYPCIGTDKILNKVINKSIEKLVAQGGSLGLLQTKLLNDSPNIKIFPGIGSFSTIPYILKNLRKASESPEQNCHD